MPRRHEHPDEWYNINRVMGMTNWVRPDGTPVNSYMIAILGDPDCGKSYSAVKWALNQKIKKPDKVKWYWLRMTDESVKKMLENDGEKTIDPDIQRKFGLILKRQGKSLYKCSESFREITKGPRAGEIESKIRKEYSLCEVLPLSTTFGAKGVQWYDKDFDGTYIIIFDEMNRESNERNTFNIVQNFARMCENLTRDTKNKLYVIMLGNNTSDASPVLQALNMIPTKFGVYKVKPRFKKGGKCSKRPGIIVDFIKPSEAYAERREGAIMSTLVGNTVTKEREFKQITNTKSPQTGGRIINFGTVKFYWCRDILYRYTSQHSLKTFSMYLHLTDGIFDKEIVKYMIEMYGFKKLQFDSPATQVAFEQAMINLKRG